MEVKNNSQKRFMLGKINVSYRMNELMKEFFPDDEILDECISSPINKSVIKTNEINKLCRDLQIILASEIPKTEADPPMEKSLYKLCMKYRYSLRDRFINDLLRLLRKEGYNQLPKNCGTFLGTPRCGKHYQIKSMKSSNGTDGFYCYLGIKNQLQHFIHPDIYLSKTIEVIVNIDGLQVYDNSTDTMWPILLKICTKKYDKKVFMVANYYGDSKPDSSEEYLKDFAKECKDLIENGVIVNGKTFKFRILGFTCDCPGRTFLKCCKGHTGFYSCERCSIKGKTFKKKANSNKGNRIFPNMDSSLRTHESFVDKEQEKHHLPNLTSTLTSIPDLNIIKDFFIDSMHLFDIGVTKKILTTWFSEKKRKFGRLQDQQIQKIDFLLRNNVKNSIPKEFHRKTYITSKCSKWKANQNRMIMLYVLAIIIKDVIEEDKYNHILLYIVSYRILSDVDLCRVNADVAKSFLRQFFKDLPIHYGPGVQVLSMHYLIHVADDVINKNMNLIKLSAYDFENHLGQMSNSIIGPANPLIQVINRIFESQHDKYENHYIKKKQRLYNIVFDENNENGEDKILHNIASLSFKGYILEANRPNNLVILHNEEYLIIDKIYSKTKMIIDSEDIFITGRKLNAKNLFEYPCQSKEIGIVELTDSHQTFSITLSAVHRKCFHLILENNISFAATMLHED